MVGSWTLGPRVMYVTGLDYVTVDRYTIDRYICESAAISSDARAVGRPRLVRRRRPMARAATRLGYHAR